MQDNDNKTLNGITEEDQLKRGKLLFGIIATLLLLIVGLWIVLHRPGISNFNSVATVETSVPIANTQTDIGTPASDGQTQVLPESKNITGWLGKYTEPPWQWFDWIILSLVGVLLYTLTVVASWYAKITHHTNDKSTKIGNKKGTEESIQFIEMTPWYISTIIKGPLVAMAILVFLTNVSVEISGLSINFTELGAEVLLVVAFVLGFYSRVAREELNVIVKTLFSKAYSWAEESFDLLTEKSRVIFGQSVQFKTTKPVEVTWLASVGKIEDGLYTAPKPGEQNVKAGQEVQITAVPKDPNIPRAIANITLWPFLITGPERLDYGKTGTYTLQGGTQSNVTWSVEPKAVIKEVMPSVYQVPEEENANGIKNFTITAQTNGDRFESVSLNVDIG